jgi:hypothetical protein
LYIETHNLSGIDLTTIRKNLKPNAPQIAHVPPGLFYGDITVFYAGLLTGVKNLIPKTRNLTCN